MLGRLPGLVELARINAHVVLVYRTNLALQLLSVLLQVYLLKVVWTAVYSNRGSVSGVPLATLISYLTLANLQVRVMLCEVTDYVYERVREGTIAQDLVRPVGLLPQLASIQVGRTAGALPLVLVALPAAAFLGGLAPPASPANAGLYVVSVTLAYAISLAAALVLSLLVFWTFETHGVTAIYAFVTQFFAGALVPLWLFPEGLRVVAEFLPFQAVAYLPLSIYLGRLEGADAIRALGIQALWVLLLCSAAMVLWRRATRRIVIQGG